MSFKAYYGLTKPGIIYGNLLTAVTGYILASGITKFNAKSFIGLVFGLSLVVGSACVINNVADRDIDARMKRTKKRATVTGEIKPKAAIIYGLVLGIIGFSLLLSLTNLLCSLIALIGFSVYISAYTYSKRKTSASTLIGSISGAMPIVGGYVAFNGHLSSAAIIIGLMMVAWQMPHFYAIAIYRKKDYLEAKIPVLPVIVGERFTAYIMVFFNLLFIGACLSLHWYAPVGIVYLVIMGLVSVGWLAFNLQGLFKPNLTRWARQSFFLSLIVVLAMSAMIAVR